MKFTATEAALRVGIAGSLATSGVVHAYLYVDGYRHIPTIGTAFLVQASVFCALAILVSFGGPTWLRIAAGLGAAGALVAFGLSRTTGLFGFTEIGWDPAPYAVVSVVAAAVTVVLCALWAFSRGTSRQG